MLIRSDTAAKPRTIDELLDPKLVARLERLDFRSQNLFPGKMKGERRSKRRGRSVEFDDYRRYTAGDDPRFIDWNTYARFRKLFLKLFLEEEDLSVRIVLDVSASMDAGKPSKLAFCARAAAALGYLGLVKNNRVGVSIIGGPGRVAHLTDVRGRRNITRLGAFVLEHAFGDSRGEGTGGEAFGDAMKQVALRCAGRGVVVLLSDMLLREGYEDGLRAISARRGFDVYCVQVLSPDELDPAQVTGGVDGGGGSDLRLIDAEYNDGREVTVSSAVIKAYRTRLEAYQQTLRDFCTSRSIVYELVQSDADVAEIVGQTFRSRGMVG